METISFEEGDSLLLYTDGLTEVLNIGNGEFGQERLAALVQQYADRTPTCFSPSGSGQCIWRNRPLVDDVTMVALKISG
jgi:serine phosphatase RsbU (regulator of sigma subunit)